VNVITMTGAFMTATIVKTCLCRVERLLYNTVILIPTLIRTRLLRTDSRLRYYVIVCVFVYHSAAALLAVQSAVLATAIPSVRPSLRYVLVPYPDK